MTRQFHARPWAVAACLVVVLAGVCGFTACAAHRKPEEPRREARGSDAVVRTDAAIVHFLDRVTFGATEEDVEAVRVTGVERFLDRQLHPEQIADDGMESRLASMQTLSLSSAQIAEQYYRPAQEARRRRQALGESAAQPDGAEQEALRRERLVLQELASQKLLRAVYSQRQFREVLVDFWFNHFNVFAGKGADRGLITEYEREAIRPYVMGKFKDLLAATAQSPAMLFYLDNWMNVDPNGPHPPATGRLNGRQPRRNIPSPARPAARTRRGLNENYARELMELHTLGVDGGFTQRDVVEVARCFTGWTIRQPRDGGDFTFNERQHDPGQKVVLGHVIKAGGGKDDGDRVLDLLARDPHTARFIATKLARRFVADAPPPSLVDRVAHRFRDTDGDLREVYRALFLSPEFWSEQAVGAKAKTAFEFLASALRATRAQVEAGPAIAQSLRILGMPPYFCQQPNGYPDRADAVLNGAALLSRMNAAVALANNRMPGVKVDIAALVQGAEGPAPREAIVRGILHGRASDSTLAALHTAGSTAQLLALALGSPEFQKH